MILNGILLGTGITASELFVYKRLPDWAKRFIKRHPLITEAGSTYASFEIVGGSVTGLFAGATNCLQLSALLWVAEHPEDFGWVAEATTEVKDEAAAQLEKLRLWAKEQAEARKRRKEMEAARQGG